MPYWFRNPNRCCTGVVLPIKQQTPLPASNPAVLRTVKLMAGCVQVDEEFVQANVSCCAAAANSISLPTFVVATSNTVGNTHLL